MTSVISNSTKYSYKSKISNNDIKSYNKKKQRNFEIQEDVFEEIKEKEKKHKQLMQENKKRRKKQEEKKVFEEEQKRKTQMELLNKRKKDKESDYLKYLRNNSKQIYNNFQKKNNNENDKPNLPKKKNENKLGSKYHNIEALNLNIEASTENLGKILKEYNKKINNDNNNFEKLNIELLEKFEKEGEIFVGKNQLLESLDLENSISKQKLERKGNFNKKLNKLDNLDMKKNKELKEENLILKDIIGYESENGEDEFLSEFYKKDDKY